MNSATTLRVRSYIMPLPLIIILFLGLGPVAIAQSVPPSLQGNLDHGLRELINMQSKGQANIDPQLAEQTVHTSKGIKATGVFRLNVDKQNRVLVNIALDGTISQDKLIAQLNNQGLAVVATSSQYRNGFLSAYAPVSALARLGHTPGISAVSLAHRARLHAGQVTSQGTTIIRSTIANARGIDGTGVTVGVLSDSFNTSSGFGVLDTALTDVLTGDLPNDTSIPGGEGLKFLIELDPYFFGPGTDEGRAMAQIVHDVAPGASLCFATADVSEVDFANNIRTLRADPGCNASVIVDDTDYEDEPFFSDGIIAQAVDDVAFSDSLPGHKVAYFSAAGNDAGQGYSADLKIISDSAARAADPASIGVNLSTIPSTIDTTGGFHNFSTSGGLLLAQTIAFLDGTDFSFQWDDPFDLSPSGITTDLNILFFDPFTGNFLFAVDDDNFQTNRPIENFTLLTGEGPGTAAEVSLVIARTGKGSHLARRIKYLTFGAFFDFSGVTSPDTPVTYGHSAAAGANSVAASVYAEDPAVFGPPAYDPHVENFSSRGPVVIAFDGNGNRLKQAEVRQKPDIAAPDGVNTTFFPQPELFGPSDYEASFNIADGFPNFFGTSAAAPHAAGAAALLIQKSGGPGSIRPDNISKALKDSAPRRDFSLSASTAVAAQNGVKITVVANGDDNSSASSTFFTVSLDSGDSSQRLTSLTIDLAGTGLAFNQFGFPLTVGASSGPSITTASPGGISSSITINFAGFAPGNFISFGIDRNFVDNTGQPVVEGDSADYLAGANITASIQQSQKGRSNNGILKGVFANQLATGFRPTDGFGLIDVENALQQIGPADESVSNHHK